MPTSKVGMGINKQFQREAEIRKKVDHRQVKGSPALGHKSIKKENHHRHERYI